MSRNLQRLAVGIAALGSLVVLAVAPAKGQAFSPVGSEFQVNTSTSSSQQDPSVAALLDGGFIVSWESRAEDAFNYDIYGQRFNAAGSAVGSEFLVNTSTASSQLDPSAAALLDGGFVVLWEGFGYDIYGQRFDAAGSAVGSEFLANTHTEDGQHNSSVAALTGGGFVVTWTSYLQDGSSSGIYGQRFDASGVPIASEFQVHTHVDGSQQNPSVAAFPGGGFVVTWASYGPDGSGYGVYGQRYDAMGSAVGSEFQVNTHTMSYQQQPSVETLTSGGFVVTWASHLQDGSDWGIYGQRFDAAGSPIGLEFQVNTHTTSNQFFPSVTELSDGGFVVTWASQGQDGSGSGIYGQRFDAAGATVGTEFQVNSYTTSDQRRPSAAALVDGGFVVTWSSHGQDGSGWGIYGQRYAPAAECAASTLSEPEYGSSAGLGTATITFSNPDGLLEVSFTTLENLTAAAPDGWSEPSPNSFVPPSGTTPDEVAFTLTQKDATVSQATYYAQAYSVCPGEEGDRLMTDFDPSLDLATPTSVETTELPDRVEIEGAYPNPFNPQTTIRFALPEALAVEAEVYDAVGRRVAVLLSGRQMSAGWHELRFEASDLPNGLYLMRLQAGAAVETTRLVHMK